MIYLKLIGKICAGCGRGLTVEGGIPIE